MVIGITFRPISNYVNYCASKLRVFMLPNSNRHLAKAPKHFDLLLLCGTNTTVGLYTVLNYITVNKCRYFLIDS